MATLDENIAEFGKSLSDARKSIISAIEAKGVDCNNSDKLSVLPSKIAQIKNSVKVKKIGCVAVYGKTDVAGTSTTNSDGESIITTVLTISNTGTLFVGGGFTGPGYAVSPGSQWVDVYINSDSSKLVNKLVKDLTATEDFVGTNDTGGDSFSLSCNVTKGQSLFILANSRWNEDPYKQVHGGVAAYLVYTTA